MKFSRVLPVIAAIFLALTFCIGVSADLPANGGDAPQFDPQRILVQFKPGVGPAETAQIHRQYGGQVKEVIPSIGIQVVTVPKGQVMGKVRAYSSNGKVAYAEPDFLAQAVGSPDDLYFGRQWGLTRVEAPQAWEVTTGSSQVNIAILDTGVDLDHPDLAAKLISNINFTTSATVDDVHGHGTHVAGIAAAITNNGIGVAGLGYTSTIMNVKVLSDSGSGYYSWIVWGIAWAADNGAEVINMSLGGSSSSSALENAINYACSKGVVVVAAAGNNGSTSPSYPACYTNCIAVAATDAHDALPSWSNYGDWVDVAAPGVSIYSTLKENGYGYKSGTSMASPYVAGLAGLVFATVSDANGDGNLNDEVRSRIEANCDDIGLSGIGYGRINAARAVGSVPVPPGQIAGQVTDAEDFSAISGVQVTDGTRTALTDAAGMYTIDDVPPGSYHVVASKEGYEDSALTVDVLSGNIAVANFSLSQLIVSGSISGSVTDAQDGSPIVGAAVTDGTRTATTDASGEYTIAGVPPGDYEVTASKEDYESSTSSVTVVSGGSSVLDFSLNQNPTVPNTMWVDSISFIKNGRNLFIEVRVVTASGVLPGAKVGLSLECSNGEVWNFSGTTDTPGLVRFKLNKPPSGTYLATVNSLTCSGFNWDMSKGVTSTSYTTNSIRGTIKR
jgi:thermitase